MDMFMVLAFLGAAILLTVMPGPDNIFVLTQSITQGTYAGISTAFGLCTGLLFHISAATVGLSALIYQSAFAFSIVKYAGAAYLLYLAYQSFRDKSSAFELRKGKVISFKSLYRKGIIMNVLNPKVSLFFLAFLPQFISPASGSVPYQMLVYGLIFLLQALFIFCLISVFAGIVGDFLRKSPAVARRINVVQGVLFSLIGLNVAFRQQ